MARFAKKFLVYSLLIQILFVFNLYSQTIKLKIIETTDEHGAIFPYDFNNMKETNHSLAQVSTYVKEMRADKNQEVVLLSGGDMLQGTPTVYYYNFEKTDVPHLWAEAMNYMKYDAAAVGNHDIETGHPVYDRVRKEFNFPWMAANAVNVSDSVPYFDAYTIIERGGIKIAVLGLITPAIPNWLPPQIWSGMQFNDMIETAKKWVPFIREIEKPDLVIGLFHAGVDFTYGNQDSTSYKNENATKLIAEEVPGFDIVYAGHDHHGWNFTVKDPEGNDVLVLGGSSVARDAAVANVTMTKTETGWQKIISGETVQMKNYKPDPEFMSKFQSGFDEVKKYVTRPIGNFTETISAKESIFGPSAFVDLIQNIQLDLTKADVSFTAPLSFNAQIDKGEIYVGNMFELYRYENLLYTMEMSGEEIKNYLEYSYATWFNQMKDGNDHLLNFERDEKGEIKYSERNHSASLTAPYYSFDCAAGINYTVDVTKPAGEKINIISMSSGDKFDPDKKYKVALNSYRGNGGGGHLSRGAGIPKDQIPKRIIASTDKDLRYYLMKWIEKTKTVTPNIIGNWKVIPEDLWQKGKERDYKILFGN